MWRSDTVFDHSTLLYEPFEHSLYGYFVFCILTLHQVVKKIITSETVRRRKETDNPNAKAQAEVTSHVSERETGIAPNP